MNAQKIIIALTFVLAAFVVQHNALYSVSAIGAGTNHVMQMTGGQMHRLDATALTYSGNALIVSCGLIALIVARRKNRDCDNA